jgi:hypothetical protein
MTALLTRYNFLLSYKDSTQLEQMNEKDRLSLLEILVSSGPSEKSWRGLLELFASWPISEQKIYALEKTNQQLSSWDDELRNINSAWIYLYDNSGLSPIVTIARSVMINRREEHGNKELIAIVNSTYSGNISNLTIVKSGIYVEGIRALASTSHLKNLRRLTMDGITLGDDAFSLLFGASNLIVLNALQLMDMRISSSRLIDLLNSNLIRSVNRLDLSFDNLDDNVVKELIGSTMWGHLESLNLKGNYLRTDGALLLLNASSSGKLKELNIAQNEIARDSREELLALANKIRVELILD